MKAFRGKVAVVTGGASGIGRGIAERCVQEGMKVVLADIMEEPLRETAESLRAAGGTVVEVVTDVAQPEQVRRLKEKTLEAYGGVHLLANNAGVGGGSSIWESTLNDWQWVMGVNLWGIVHGLREFVPVMLAQDEESHIVNTASIAGLLPFHPGAIYQVTKHAVVALSENLYYTLALGGPKVGASVLCPGWVQTNIMDSERCRPEGLQNAPEEEIVDPVVEAIRQQFTEAIANGMPRDELADHVFRAIREGRFYILPHQEYNEFIRMRMECIQAGENLPLAPVQAMLQGSLS